MTDLPDPHHPAEPPDRDSAVDQFDRRARGVGDLPDEALAGVLAGHTDNDLVLDLAGRFETLGRDADDGAVAEPVVERYAGCLAELAGHWGDEAGRALRAVVDVVTAERHLRHDDAATAGPLLRRCEADLTELLPQLLGDRELLVAWSADAAGDPKRAREHADLAHDLFCDEQRWDDAAVAAECAAGTLDAAADDAVRRRCRAADLYADAGQPDEARDCVERAAQATVEALAGRTGRTELSDLAVLDRLRAAARAHGPEDVEFRLGLVALAHACETDAGWSVLTDLHRRTQREVALLVDPGESRVASARADLLLGRVAALRQRRDDALRLLDHALPPLRDAGLDEDAHACATMLAMLRGEPAPAPTGATPDWAAVAGILGEVLALAAADRIDEARSALERLPASADRLGGAAATLAPVLVDAVSALLDAHRGDRSALPAASARIEATRGDPTLPHIMTGALDAVAGALRDAATVPASSGPAAMDPATAVADVRHVLAAPPDTPGRAHRAVELLHAAAWTENVDLSTAQLARLLDLAESAAPTASWWPRTRIAARFQLLNRRLADDEYADPDDAAAPLAELTAEAGNDKALFPLVLGARAALRQAQRLRHGVGDGDSPAEDLAPLFGLLPPDHPIAATMRELLAADSAGLDPAALARLRATMDRMDPGELRNALSEALDSMDTLVPEGAARPTDGELAELVRRADAPAPDPLRGAHRHTAVAQAALHGGTETDPRRIELAVVHARRALQVAGPASPQRVFDLSTLALALLRRAEVGAGRATAAQTSATLDETRTVLEQARTEAAGPGHPMWPMLGDMYSAVLRLLDGSTDAHLAAVEGLRGHAWRVLSAPTLAGATDVARRAVVDALDVATQCVLAEDADRAVAALDTGRGLALYAATATGGFADQLAALDPELADRWRTAVADGPERAGPELRRTVLRALTDGDGATGLLDPPPVDDIRAALREIDADALVYLVPAATPLGGYAAHVPASDAPARVTLLPDLHSDAPDLGRWLVSLRDFYPDDVPDPPAAPTSAAEPGSGSDELDALCRWAWDAALGTLLDDLRLEPPDHRPLRLVLIPMGDLARVPWQAARRGSDGRYAIEDVAISQVASARMLCRSAALPPVSIGPGGLVVSDPDTAGAGSALPGARVEALTVREDLYPGARLLGRRPDGSTSPSGRGGEREVRDWLTDTGAAAGSVLHLACHGVVDDHDGAPDSYLLLADGERLRAARIVELLRPVPERGIALAVLAACHSGRAMTGYDEAYSLGTAFLAAGVRSVLATQWAIPDAPTSVLMYLFHRFLRVDGLPVWAALREAQLCLLRGVATVPLPAHLRGTPVPGVDPALAWAAFVHGGR